MYFKEYIDIGKVTETIVDNETVLEAVYKKVFANKLSVFRKEYYEAKKVGLKPEVAFEVRIEDYDNETRVKLNGKEYYLIRSSENQRNEMIELFFSSEVGAKNEYEWFWEQC